MGVSPKRGRFYILIKNHYSPRLPVYDNFAHNMARRFKRTSRKKRKRSFSRFKKSRRIKRRRKSRKKKMSLTRAMTKITIQPKLPGKMQPKSVTMNMKFAVFYELQPPSGNALTSRQFSANGMHNIDLDGGSDQAYGWDQIRLWYNKYEVLASKIKITTIHKNGAVYNGVEVEHIEIIGTGTNIVNTTEGDVEDIQTRIRRGTMKATALRHRRLDVGDTNHVDRWLTGPVLTKSWSKTKYKAITREVEVQDFIPDTLENPDGLITPLFTYVHMRNNSDYGNIASISATGVKQYLAEIEYKVRFTRPRAEAISQ